MRARKVLALGAGLSMAAAVALAPGVGAQTTDVSFTLNNGTLSITTPASATLSQAGSIFADGVTFSGTLGDTTVTDGRNATSGWNVSFTATDFALSTDPETTIPASNVKMFINPVSDILVTVSGALQTLLGGTELFVPNPTPVSGSGQIGQLVDLTTLGLGSLLGVTAANQVTYDPEVTVTVPPGTPDGTYEATITQTVL